MCVILGVYHYHFKVFNPPEISTQIRQDEPQGKIRDGESMVLVNWIKVVGGPKDGFELINLNDGMSMTFSFQKYIILLTEFKFNYTVHVHAFLFSTENFH